MKIPFEILLIACSTGTIQSGFLSIYLFLSKKQATLSHKLLAFLILALTIRMAKSAGYYFSQQGLPAPVENIGYAAHIAIAPLLFLYVKSFLNPELVFGKKYWIHLLPAFCILLLSPFLSHSFWLGEFNGYRFSLYYMGLYLPFIYYLLWKNLSSKKHMVSKPEWTWLMLLTVGITLVWAAYSANFLLGWVTYITAPVIFSLFIYVASFFLLKQHIFLFKEAKSTGRKYKNSSLTQQQLQFWADQILHAMEKDKPYQDQQFNLARLSRMTGASSHITSEVINRHFQKNFPDFITGFRLQDAMLTLENNRQMNEKIASIAFEAGFSTLSSFNTAFKKHTKMTPSEYRKKFCTQKESQ